MTFPDESAVYAVQLKTSTTAWLAVNPVFAEFNVSVYAELLAPLLVKTPTVCDPAGPFLNSTVWVFSWVATAIYVTHELSLAIA